MLNSKGEIKEALRESMVYQFMFLNEAFGDLWRSICGAFGVERPEPKPRVEDILDAEAEELWKIANVSRETIGGDAAND